MEAKEESQIKAKERGCDDRHSVLEWIKLSDEHRPLLDKIRAEVAYEVHQNTEEAINALKDLQH
jgi:hypothetical protein